MATRQVSIWDPAIRLFHWSLAALIGFQVFTAETGQWFYDWHRHAGEAVLALVAFRLLWGIAGSSNARLLPLAVGLPRAPAHLKRLLVGQVNPTRGHNSAGGLAVIVLLALCLIQALSGLYIADEDEMLEGALYGRLDSDLLYRVHMLNAKALITVIILHVCMVFFYLLRAGKNLISPMITGRTDWPDDIPLPDYQARSPWLALALLLITGLLCGWWLGWFS